MKTCPQCNQTYTDDLSFCLSDGSPLANLSEIPTVVKPRVAASGPKRTNILVPLLAALLALSLGITAAVLYFFWPRNTNSAANTTQAAVTNSNRPTEAPTATPQPSPSLTVTPAPTRSPRPSETPDPDDQQTGSDPGPTRISFSAGRASATVDGEVWRQRTYLLYAARGQSLNARINSPDECASFSNGSRTMGFSTQAGYNSLTVVNECEDQASFSLTVSIR